MAETIDLGFSNIMSKTQGFTDLMIYLFVIILVAGFTWLILYYLSFKHKVRVRQVVNGRTVIIDDKARFFKDKDKIPKWKLWKMRDVVSLPDDDCLDLTTKGKKVAECFRTDDGTYIWIKSNFDYEKYKANNPEFEPFSTEERQMLVTQYREAIYGKASLLDKVMQFAPYIIVLMILVIFMIFFNETVAPTQALAGQLITATDKMSQSLETINAICLGRVLVTNNTQYTNISKTVPGGK